MKVALVALAVLAAGCLTLPGDLDAQEAPSPSPIVLPDDPYYAAVLDPAVGYHTLEILEAKIDAIAASRPDIVRIETIGTSVEGRAIRALVFENRSVTGSKLAPFIDGGHHPNEVEGIEVTVYLADVLALSYGRNASLTALVDRSEIWIVPLVNPDGYVTQTRFNANRVNLNRNYDIDWGDPAAFNTAGPLADLLNGDMLGNRTGGTPEYAGTAPFSEPESAAIRDATSALGGRLAFYLSHHTDVHCITAPWTAPQPPFPMPTEHREVFDDVFAWVEANTEFGAGDWTWLTGECMSYSAGGTSMDWAYMKFEKPSFTLETSGSPEREGAGIGKPTSFLDAQQHGDLPHWVVATLPIELFLLANAENLAAWQAPTVEPSLPEGGA